VHVVEKIKARVHICRSRIYARLNVLKCAIVSAQHVAKRGGTHEGQSVAVHLSALLARGSARVPERQVYVPV
jgi:hypothetical protein